MVKSEKHDTTSYFNTDASTATEGQTTTTLPLPIMPFKIRKSNKTLQYIPYQNSICFEVNTFCHSHAKEFN